MTDELITKLILDSKEFKNKIQESVNDVSSLSSSFSTMAKIGVASFTAVVAAVTLVSSEVFKAADKVSVLYDNTRKLGVSVAAFQELSVAAKEAGVSTESLQNLMALMNKNLGNASLGIGKAKASLSALGLSMESLNGLSTDQKFEKIAAQLGKIKDIGLQTSLASMIFGKGAKDAIGLFNSDIEETITKVKSLGFTLTDSQAAGLDKLSETRELIGSMWEGFKDNVAAELAPAFQELYDRIIESVQNMGGLKAVAKDTADYIIKAMDTMSDALDRANTTIKTLKATGITGALYTALETAYKLNPLVLAYNGIQSNGAAVGKAFSSYLPDSVSDQSIAAQDPVSKLPSISKAIKDAPKSSNGLLDINARDAIAAFKATSNEASIAAKALQTMKTAALKAAETLDSFGKIKEALNAPGKKQADEIVNNGVGALQVQLAPTEEFQSIFNEILKNNASDKDPSLQVSLLEKLQNIISIERNKNGSVTTSNESGFRSDDTEIKQDVSGLVTALNELKAFLAGKANTDKEVKVNIKVEPSKDFVTSVTQTTSFKDAVEAKFAALVEEAARARR